VLQHSFGHHTPNGSTIVMVIRGVSPLHALTTTRINTRRGIWLCQSRLIFSRESWRIKIEIHWWMYLLLYYWRYRITSSQYTPYNFSSTLLSPQSYCGFQVNFGGSCYIIFGRHITIVGTQTRFGACK
jgi:hypothetical protein